MRDRGRARRQCAAAARRADDRRGAARQRPHRRAGRWRRSPREHQLVITHGNGPQVGLLALQGAAYKPDEAYPLDVLGAETEGMIGYMIEQELGNLLPFEVPFATILTMVEVDPDDPGFGNPTKFIGPVYDEGRGRAASAAREGLGRQAGRRQVAARRRLARAQADLRDPADPVAARKGVIVIAAGGGGIPTVYEPGRTGSSSASRRSSTRTSARSCWRASWTPTCSSWRPTPTRSSSTGASPTQRAIRRADPPAHRRAPFPGGLDGAEGGRRPAGSPRRPGARRRSARWPTWRRSCAARRGRSVDRGFAGLTHH